MSKVKPVTNMFEKEVRVGDLVILATNNGDCRVAVVTKLPEPGTYGDVTTRLFIKERKWDRNTQKFSDPFIHQYSRNVTNIRSSVPYELDMLPPDFQEAIHDYLERMKNVR